MAECGVPSWSRSAPRTCNEAHRWRRCAAPLAAHDVEGHLEEALEHEGMKRVLAEEQAWVERLLPWLHRYRRALEEALAPTTGEP
jgi:hypothetical protein